MKLLLPLLLPFFVCSHSFSTQNEHNNQRRAASHNLLKQTEGILTKSKCLVQVNGKYFENRGRPTVIILGEFHYQVDIRTAVTCIRDSLVKELPEVGFIGLEGVKYGSQPQPQSIKFLRLQSLPRPIDLIGLDIKYYGLGEDPEFNRIDNEHKRLAKLKMEIGLSPLQDREYDYISWKSYELIIVKRSKEWVQHVTTHLKKTASQVGILQVGSNHIQTLQDFLKSEKINYVTLEPRISEPICICEAYYVKRPPSKDPRSCRDICNDEAIAAVWD